MIPQLCFLCQEEGREQVAHRVDSRGPVCQWHFRGELHPEVVAARRDERKILEGKVKVQVKGGPMPKSVDEGTITAIKKDVAAGMTLGKIAENRGLSVSTVFKYAGGRNGKKKGRGGRASTASIPQPSPGLFTLTVTPEQLDALWAMLPAERKAALINKLAEA